MRPGGTGEAAARGRGLRALFCLALLALPGGSALALDLPFLRAGLSLSTGKDAYWRYEMVDFQIEAPGGLLNPRRHPILEVRLFKDGRPAAGLPGREGCLLHFDANLQSWRGRWPIPWNPELGVYEARLAVPADPGAGARHVYFAGPGLTRCVDVLEDRWLAACRFQLRGRRPHGVPPGFCAVTLEPGSASYRFPGPQGGRPSAEQALEWARYMQADAFWHCALQTQVWKGQAREDLPWMRQHLQAVSSLAEAASSRGLAYGAYMLTFLVSGDFRRTPYDFTLGYNSARDRLEQLRFVSMADPRRQRDLVGALRQLSATPGVAYIGMDYVRADTGGLEFTDQFLHDFDLDVPAELKRASVAERRLWLGRHLARDRDRSLHDLWDWWRAHQVSLVLKGVLEEARPAQPVWVFSLGWKQGHQHGQDPRMLIDAGVSFNAPMFYEADQEQYPAMLRDWQRYLGRTGGTLVLGQCVDSRLLHPRPGLNGPEEYLRRRQAELAALGPLTDRLGFFWHDLGRAIAGGRGAQGLREWALTGAASFAQLREASGGVPLALEVKPEGLQAPEVPGQPARLLCRVRVRNLTAASLDRVKVAPLWTPGLGESEPQACWLEKLQAGEARSLTFTASLAPRGLPGRYRGQAEEERLLAFQASAWEDPEWPRSDVAVAYWKAGRP